MRSSSKMPMVTRVLIAWAALACMTPLPALAVSCTTQSQMTEAQRNSLAASAKSLAALVQAGNTAALKAETIPSVAERFDPIAAAAESASPLIERGTLTVETLYLLDSRRLKGHTEEETHLSFAAGANSHEVVLTIHAASAGQLCPRDPACNWGRVSPIDYLYSGAGVDDGDAVEAGWSIYSWVDVGRT